MIRVSVKSAVLVVPLALAAAAACSSDPAETFGGGGTGNGAGTSSSTAGTSSPTAGTPSSGGSNAAAGTSSTAGTSPSAGTSSTGGTAAGGTASGGNGGTGTGGTSGGAGGGGGSGGGGACDLDCVAGVKNEFQEALSNSFIMVGCYSKAAQDCITIPAGAQCPNQDSNLPMEQQGITSKETFKVGGTAGTHYLLTINVNGMSEAKYYEKGERAAGNTDPANPDAVNGTDTFYTGGNPVNFENYNIYKITSLDDKGAEVAHYYLNSMPKTNTPYEDHSVYPIAYTHDIEVVGGGSVVYLSADRNCHAVDNCGIGHQSASCAQTAGRKIPNENDLVLPTMYMGKPVSQINLFGGNSQPFHSQVIHIVAKAVKPK